MGKAQSKDQEYKSEEFQEAKRQIEEKGVAGAQAMMKATLIGWKDIKIRIGVTGNSGVGKSSFINAIRGYGTMDLSLLIFVLDSFRIRFNKEGVRSKIRKWLIPTEASLPVGVIAATGCVSVKLNKSGLISISSSTAVIFEISKKCAREWIYHQ